ncbi:hypothetical protein U1Q18_024787 [Sarracenia purpurea var. burkii]
MVRFVLRFVSPNGRLSMSPTGFDRSTWTVGDERRRSVMRERRSAMSDYERRLSTSGDERRWQAMSGGARDERRREGLGLGFESSKQSKLRDGKRKTKG